jgi:hypothetical protein
MKKQAIAPNQGLRNYDWFIPIKDLLTGIRLFERRRRKKSLHPKVNSTK